MQRVIQAVHHSDLPDPSPWIMEHTLLITHGDEFAKSTSEGIRYLDRISQKTSALVVGTGPHTRLKEVQPQIVKRAQDITMPLLEARNVPFRQIYSYVYHALASQDMHQLRRTLSLEKRLLHLLTEGEGLGPVLSELGGMLELTLILFTSHGKVLAHGSPRGRLNVRLIWDAYRTARANSRTNGTIHLKDDHLRFQEIRVHKQVEAVLAAASPETPISELAEAILSNAELPIALKLAGDGQQRLVARRRRTALLRDFTACEDDGNEYREHLLSQGIDLDAPWRALLIHVEQVDGSPGAAPGPSDHDIYSTRASIVDSVEAWFADQHTPAIAAEKGPAVVVLIASASEHRESLRQTLRQLSDSLARSFSNSMVHVGASGEAVGSSHPAALYRQAAESVQLARENAGNDQGPIIWEDARARFRLVEGQSKESLKMLCGRLVDPLVEYDNTHRASLLKTARVFVDSRLSRQQSADALFIHRNTLQKRLRRIEGILQISFGNIDDIMELYVALRAAEILGRSDDPRRMRDK